MKSLRNLTRLLALIPILTGIVTLLGVQDPIYKAALSSAPPVLDSNLRFFGGLWLALGLMLMWASSDLDQNASLFRFAWFGIFLGGIGRMISIVSVGLPPLPFVFFTILEIVGAPLFLMWHAKLLRHTRS